MADSSQGVALRTLAAQFANTAVNFALAEQDKVDKDDLIAALQENVSLLQRKLTEANQRLAQLTDGPIEGEVVERGD